MMGSHPHSNMHVELYSGIIQVFRHNVSMQLQCNVSTTTV